MLYYIGMSKNSEHVKAWRKKVKDRIINAMGGKCCCCGYSKCPRSLALHHLDPSKKDFSFGKVKAHPKKWELVVAELRKCILVCHNCHCEIHYGMTNPPNNATVFDEAYLNYKTEKNPECSECLYCGKLKPTYQKYCSYQCSSKAHYKVDWDNINLEEELKTLSVVQLSEKLGCSDGAIHKRLRKIGFDKTKLLYQNGMARRERR